MITLRLGTSFWLDRSTAPTSTFPRLGGAHAADVVIVGGGITGCVCAYRLAASGVRVVLVEARAIGRGSTAASTALLMQETDTDLSDLEARYGRTAAGTIWRESHQGVRAFVRTLRELRIDADLRMVPSVYFSRQADEVRGLRAELRRRHRAHLRGRWLSSAQLRALTGIDGAGAILTRGNAQVDPYRACVGFARAARRQGAAIYEHSPVTRIRRTGDGVRVELARGHVTASDVIIATGYATKAFKPLAGRFRLLNTYVVTTPPLPPARRAAMGLGDVMLWDTDRPYHYARWTPDHRLLFGGRDRPHVEGRARQAASLARATALLDDLGELYPTLADVRPDYAWEGLFATTPDGLPYIGRHRRYPRHLFALGYGGNGMTFGFLAAQILTRALHGKPDQSDALFGFGRLRR